MRFFIRVIDKVRDELMGQGRERLHARKDRT